MATGELFCVFKVSVWVVWSHPLLSHAGRQQLFSWVSAYSMTALYASRVLLVSHPGIQPALQIFFLLGDFLCWFLPVCSPVLAFDPSCMKQRQGDGQLCWDVLEPAAFVPKFTQGRMLGCLLQQLLAFRKLCALPASSVCSQWIAIPSFTPIKVHTS